MTSTYSIRSVSKITGLTPERIRSWEDRFSVVSPARTDTGRRSYSDSDLAHLQLLADAVGAGHPISDLAGLTVDDLNTLVEKTAPMDMRPDTNAAVTRLLDDLAAMDIQRCDATLSAALVNMEPWQFVTELVTPLLHRIGDLWQAGDLDIGQEHFISNLVRMKLYASIQSMPPAWSRSLVLFTTLGGERHEIGAIAACYLTRASGVRAEYLGADMPANDVIELVKGLECSVLGLSITAPAEEEDTLQKVQSIIGHVPATTQIWLGGAYAGNVGKSIGAENCQVIGSPDQFRLKLSKL